MITPAYMYTYVYVYVHIHMYIYIYTHAWACAKTPLIQFDCKGDHLMRTSRCRPDPDPIQTLIDHITLIDHLTHHITFAPMLQALVDHITASYYYSKQKGDDTVGNPRRANISPVEMFELFVLLNLEKRLSIEQFEPAASQSAVPSTPLKNKTFHANPSPVIQHQKLLSFP